MADVDVELPFTLLLLLLMVVGDVVGEFVAVEGLTVVVVLCNELVVVVFEIELMDTLIDGVDEDMVFIDE